MGKRLKPKRRYGVVYFLDARKFSFDRANAWGSCETLVAACGNAARHVARSDYVGSEYRKAIIWDRHTSRIVKVFSRTGGGISVKEME